MERVLFSLGILQFLVAKKDSHEVSPGEIGRLADGPRDCLRSAGADLCLLVACSSGLLAVAGAKPPDRNTLDTRVRLYFD